VDARDVAKVEHLKARASMEAVQQTSNPIRLLTLSLQIQDALAEALRLDPDNVQARLDRVRYLVTAPAIVGGDVDDARAEAREIAARDPALGAFARGYIAYREKEYGPARRELREAVRIARDAETKALALKWLGWLSQETQQWDEAFAVFDTLQASDASARYEIGRTAAFCTCRLERGKSALAEYIAGKRGKEMPSLAMARYQLGLVLEKLGERDEARREIEQAWRLDRSIAGLKDARKRLR
jgi:tetratricopeptide (TPR) repeat protein